MGKISAINYHRAGGRSLEQIHTLSEGALASTAGADDRKDLTSLDAEIKILEHGDRAFTVTVNLGQLLEADHEKAIVRSGLRVCMHPLC
jgi:hypothetical protein